MRPSEASSTTATPTVTTGPIPGSRKIHVGKLDVGMRIIDLPHDARQQALVQYDTFGPYTDPAARIDLACGLAPRRSCRCTLVAHVPAGEGGSGPCSCRFSSPDEQERQPSAAHSERPTRRLPLF